MSVLDPEAQVVYATGHCLLTWGKVEATLCTFFCIILDPHTRVAVRTWEAVQNFRDKLKMLNAATAARLEEIEAAKSLLFVWPELVAYVESQSRLRNQVAHSTYLPVNGRPLIHPYYSFLKDQTVRLDLGAIERRTKDFEELAHAVIWAQKQAADVLEMPVKKLMDVPADEPALLARLRQKRATRES